MLPKNSALLVIDVQNGIDESDYWGGNRNNPDAEKNIGSLVEHWRTNGRPVIFVKHDSVNERSPFRPGQPGNKLKSMATPRDGESIITKSTANAFVNTSLQEELLRYRIQELVIVGFVTNNSVESTARMAGDLGYSTYVVSDATACFDKVGLNGVTYGAELVHLISLSNLKDEYAVIVETNALLGSLYS